jgi:hypothetical protein
MRFHDVPYGNATKLRYREGTNNTVNTFLGYTAKNSAMLSEIADSFLFHYNANA